jgi:hypothetical protein
MAVSLAFLPSLFQAEEALPRAGPKREIYLDQMLEIQFPMKSAAL